MNKTDKILAKYGIKLGKKKNLTCRVKDQKVEQLIKETRDNLVKAFVQSKLNDSAYIESLLNKVAVQEVSRNYSEIRQTLGTQEEIVWGKGGHQTKRISELEQKGIKYYWIEQDDE